MSKIADSTGPVEAVVDKTDKDCYLMAAALADEHAALAEEGEAPFSDERAIDDTDRLRFIVENNWIATKIRCRFGIQDGNLDSAREAIDRQIETRRLP